MELDHEVVHNIRHRTVTGPRNPYKIKLLGQIGEFLAPRLLHDAGFTDFHDLNKFKTNHEDADLLAVRKKRFAISVKARNAFERTGQLNSRYKLENGRTRKISDALQTAASHNSEFAWLTIQLWYESYNAYFGTHTQLLSLGLNGKGVVMTPDYTEEYEELARDERHTLPYELVSNLEAA